MAAGDILPFSVIRPTFQIVEYADVEQDLELVVVNVYEPAALQAANDAAGGDAEEASAESVPADNGEGAPVEVAE